MRNSNVYEERSLGIYADDPQEQPVEARKSFLSGLKSRVKRREGATESRGYFVRQQLRGQLANDQYWIVLAILFIIIVETGQFERDPVHYSCPLLRLQCYIRSHLGLWLCGHQRRLAERVIRLLRRLARAEQVDLMRCHDSRAASRLASRDRCGVSAAWGTFDGGRGRRWADLVGEKSVEVVDETDCNQRFFKIAVRQDFYCSFGNKYPPICNINCQDCLTKSSLKLSLSQSP